MYDLVVICGLPRSGTTYLHKLFDGSSRNKSKMGDQFVAYTTEKFGGKWSLMEPQEIATDMSNGVAPWGRLKTYIEHLKPKAPKDAVYVYKHPQAIFFDPPKDYPYTIKYIICVREDFDKWKASAKEHDGSGFGNPELKWLTDNWKGDFEKPVDKDARYNSFYELCNERINHLRSMVDYVMFIYDKPLQSMINICDALEIEVDAHKLIKETWKPRR